MTFKYRILFPTLSIVISLVLIYAVGEVVFSIAPTFDGVRPLPLNDQHPVKKYAPNRDVVWSKDWDFKYRNDKHVNNVGFVNDQNYMPEAETPLLAVIGDSYIEAMMVAHRSTLQGRLQEQVGAKGRIYSFGASGAALPDYLVWADYAHRTFNPDSYVISVAGNDFDESLFRYKSKTGFHYFEERGESLFIRRSDFEVSFFRKFVTKSAFARYLIYHLHVHHTLLSIRSRLLTSFRGWAGEKADPPTAVFFGNTAERADSERILLSKKAIDFFLKNLPVRAGVVPEKITILVDGLRQAIYAPQKAKSAKVSYFGIMREHLIKSAGATGYTVVDLHAPMLDHYQRTGQRMEFQYDWHWNAIGHYVAAKAVVEAPSFKSIF